MRLPAFHVRVGAFTLCAAIAFPQTPASPTSELEAKAAPSVVSVVTRHPGGGQPGVGTGIVVRKNGIILTALHMVKDATSVQVRFRNGEIFDAVQLLGIDTRRDVAAIKITASGLPVLAIATSSTAKPGEDLTIVTNVGSTPWSTSTGVISMFRMADEVTGAGSGYRIMQFSAPVLGVNNGGLVMNAQGEALGLMVGMVSNMQNVNFAVPLDSVTGLADLPAQRAFGTGSAPAASAANRPVNPDQATPGAPEKSDALAVSKDVDFIRRNFKTMYVEARRAQYFGSDQLKAALGRNKDFAALNIRMVNDRQIADVVLEVGYTFAWDFPFELKHQNSSTVLVSGKGVGPFSGPAGAASVASEFVKLMKPWRTAATTK